MMRPTQQLDQILQRCLEQMDGGASIDEIVRAYPERASELIPLLEAAREARGWQVPAQSAEVRQAALARAREAFAAQYPADRTPPATPQPRKRYRASQLAWRYVAAFAFIFALLGTSVAAAQDDLPGDMLYSVKLGSEQVRLGLARSPRERADLLLSFAQRRTDECLALTRAQRSIEGSLAAIENEYALAWEAINAVPAAERTELVERFESNVERQQAELTTVLNTASPPAAARSTLEQVLEALRAAQQRIGTINITPPSQGTPSPQQSAGATPSAQGTAITPTPQRTAATPSAQRSATAANATPGAAQTGTPTAIPNQTATALGSGTTATSPTPNATRQSGTATPTQRQTQPAAPTATPLIRRTGTATVRPPAQPSTPSPSAEATNTPGANTATPNATASAGPTRTPGATPSAQETNATPEYTAPVVTPTVLSTSSTGEYPGVTPTVPATPATGEYPGVPPDAEPTQATEGYPGVTPGVEPTTTPDG